MNSESSDDEVKDTKQRKLDVATTASLDLVALNNKVISMRGQIKKVKVQVIHRHTRQIKALQRKERGPEKLLEKNKRKAEKLVEEVQVIKDLKPDRIAKYAIGHTASFNEVCKEPRSSLETRALARLTDHKILQDSVKEFRQDHDDWRSLAAFLMSRNSGRRIKKHQQNRVDKIITNVKAGEVLVKSFLKNRLEGDEEELEKIKNLNAVKTNSENVVQESCGSVAKSGLSGDDGRRSDMESDLSEEESEEYSEEETDRSEEELSEGVAETQEVETLPQTKASKHSADSSENKKSKTLSKKERHHNKSSEIVIKKLNMDDFDVESEIPTDTVPSFLTAADNKSSSSDAKTQKSKKKDAFFVTSDDSGEEGEDEDDKEEVNYRLKGDNPDDSDEEMELERGKHAFRSTFLGSLSEKDWRKSSQERNPEKTRRTNAPRSATSFPTNKKGREFPKKNPKQSFRPKEARGSAGKVDNLKDEKLHPSWIASKKRKEQSQIQAFQGKKIKFDD